MSQSPHVIILAGPNGAGKSTSAPALLRDVLAVEIPAERLIEMVRKDEPNYLRCLQ